jgi:hypothetical protein
MKALHQCSKWINIIDEVMKMFKKIKQIFNEWLDNALEEEIQVIIPYKYRDKKIKEIKIILKDDEEENGKDN